MQPDNRLEEPGPSSRRAANMAFALSSAAGFCAIFFDRLVNHEFMFFLPAAIVAVYGAIVHRRVRYSTETELCEHQMDTIYFLGFLFTLASLITLFYRLRFSTPDPAGLAGAVFYSVGVSTSTSIAGVLLRSIVRGAWLRDHPADDENRLAEGRREALRVLTDKESAYVDSLGRFITATDSFSRNLERSSEGIGEAAGRLAQAASGLTRDAESFVTLNAGFAAAAETLRRDAERVPLAELANELQVVSTRVRELTSVVDSVIELLEYKVERVG